MKTAERTVDDTAPAISTMRFSSGRSKRLKTCAQMPAVTVMQITAVYTIFIHMPVSVSPNRGTEEASAPFPNTGIKSSSTVKTSSKPQIREVYFPTVSLLSFSAAAIISCGQISSSMVTEKKRDISFKESILGKPLPDSHLDIAVLET